MHEERDGRGPDHERPEVKRMAPRPHPKPEPVQPGSLNQAIRQELWYIDTMMAAPFRTMRRMLGRGGSNPLNPLMEGMDEIVWAWEGMSRLPVKVLQAAFGEELGRTKPGPGKSAGTPPQAGDAAHGKTPAG